MKGVGHDVNSLTIHLNLAGKAAPGIRNPGATFGSGFIGWFVHDSAYFSYWSRFVKHGLPRSLTLFETQSGYSAVRLGVGAIKLCGLVLSRARSSVHGQSQPLQIERRPSCSTLSKHVYSYLESSSLRRK